jgi:hypothetical protein
MKLNLKYYPESAYTYSSYADLLIQAAKYEEAKPIVKQGAELAKQSKDEFLIKSFNEYLDQLSNH